MILKKLKDNFTTKDKAYLFKRFDEETVTSQLPAIKKEVTHSYLMNVRYVRRTITEILDRKLNVKETKRFYKVCFEMALRCNNSSKTLFKI